MNKQQQIISNETRGKSTFFARFVVLLSAVVMLIFCAIVALRAVHSYRDTVRESQFTAERFTETFADHVEQTFTATNLTLNRAVERQYFNALFGQNLAGDLEHNFAVWINQTPQIAAMLMTDKHGKITAIGRAPGYETWLDGTESVNNKPFFMEQLAQDNPDYLFLGKQESWMKRHDGFIVLSRRISELDGSFGGIIVAAVDLNYIAQFIRAIEAKKRTSYILFDDKEVLAESLDDLQEHALITGMRQDLISRIRTDHVVMRADKDSIDDEFRIVSFQALSSVPLTVGVVNYGSDLFQTWWDERMNDVIILVLLALFILVISFFAIALTRQMHRVEASEETAIMASKAKSDFLANMSHELRTPLNAIIGFSEMLRTGYFGKVNEKQTERIDDINHCGNHLLTLINDVLDFSKGEAGKMELKISRFSLTELIAETLNLFEDKAIREGLTLRKSLPRKFPHVKADMQKLRQILLNLLSNAFKFTEKHGTIEVKCKLNEKQQIEVMVSDTGIGIAEKDLPKALSPFDQIEDGKNVGGTGLGLPLSKMFAELHGGFLRLESIRGIGTKVTLVLPRSCVVGGEFQDMESHPFSTGSYRFSGKKDEAA